ncbi:hypothetical protein OIE62_38500 [Streptomyces scopuliridis]|uniref:Uncharacterized protein n=1 Tax=Streptomyces scopuliridis TaxID=452529 RepID=A0ACD4ZYQ8_9ACTN|nr:hypothetical protein [Streptomyces scopuliridis]WSB38975.1 hypothetical protein OG949_01805 [Streptomyces scopuliridis]WSC03423.1 hypothetical protein OG835_02420 [Streptomyces scopuliridis]WSC11281.1 hypothetical protein OIE62_38500 [Streptomyces scopuliridis]
MAPKRGSRDSYAERGGYDEETTAAMAVLDPSATVRTDVELLRSTEAATAFWVPPDSHTALWTYCRVKIVVK